MNVVRPLFIFPGSFLLLAHTIFEPSEDVYQCSLRKWPCIRTHWLNVLFKTDKLGLVSSLCAEIQIKQKCLTSHILFVVYSSMRGWNLTTWIFCVDFVMGCMCVLFCHK